MTFRSSRPHDPDQGADGRQGVLGARRADSSVPALADHSRHSPFLRKNPSPGKAFPSSSEECGQDQVLACADTTLKGERQGVLAERGPRPQKNFQAGQPFAANHWVPPVALSAVVFVPSVHLPFHQCILPLFRVRGFDLCQRMQDFCRLNEPGAGFFLGKRKTLTNYPFEQASGLVICPSTCPVLQGSVRAAGTAGTSLCQPMPQSAAAPHRDTLWPSPERRSSPSRVDAAIGIACLWHRQLPASPPNAHPTSNKASRRRLVRRA